MTPIVTDMNGNVRVSITQLDILNIFNIESINFSYYHSLTSIQCY